LYGINAVKIFSHVERNYSHSLAVGHRLTVSQIAR